MEIKPPNIIDFSDLNKVDVEPIGKKAEMISVLIQLGIPIQDGFVITPFLHLSENLIREVYSGYRRLSGVFKEISLNIFISPLKGNSLQFSNVKGDANLILKIKEIWALQLHKPVAIVVQKNIKSKTKGTIVTDNPTKELEHIAKKIQKYFYFPQEIDYVIEKNKIYITGIKPFTGKIEKLQKQVAQNRAMQKMLIKGVSINPGIVTGTVKVFRDNHDSAKIKNGEIIVLSHLSVSSYRKIKKAKAVVIDDGLSNSYDKMLYRKDVKVPTIVGAKNATKILHTGNVVTVDGQKGEVYKGGLN